MIQEPVKWHSGDKSILKWNQERTGADMWARFLRILVKGENDMVISEGSTFSWYSIFMYNTNGTKRKKLFDVRKKWTIFTGTSSYVWEGLNSVESETIHW